MKRLVMHALGVVSTVALACTVGVRAQGAFEVDQALGDAQVLIVDVPDTSIEVAGCDRTVVETCPAAVQVRGRWHAIGATRSEAQRNAARPALIFEPYDALLRLSAAIPLEVQGLVDLALDPIGLPSDVDLELRTSEGDVSVQDMASAVLIDIEHGDVTVDGPLRGLSVHSLRGSVVATVAGAVDIDAHGGGVYVEQLAGAADLEIDAPRGEVDVWLGSDADVDVEVRTPGRIQVQTEAFVAQTSGRWDGRTGAGSFVVQIVAGGDVRIRLRRPDA